MDLGDTHPAAVKETINVSTSRRLRCRAVREDRTLAAFLSLHKQKQQVAVENKQCL